MGICEPHFAALDAKLTEAINTLLNSRNDDLARQLINVKETAVKTEAGRLKGRQLLWTVYEHYKVEPKSAVLFEMIDLVKTQLHGDKLAEFLATWDNVMIHIDESTVDTDLKGSIFEQQMDKSVKMTEYFKMYQRAPEGHEHRTYKSLFDSAITERYKTNVNTECYKTNRDRRQTTEYDSVPGPERKMIPSRMPGKNIRERARSERRTPRRPRRTNPIRVRHRYADFTSLANAKREAVANSDTVRERSEL